MHHPNSLKSRPLVAIYAGVVTNAGRGGGLKETLATVADRRTIRSLIHYDT
jgi:hypothetical protein